jgi:hypothetical protein
MFKHRIGQVAVAVAALLGAASGAQATVALTFIDGSNTVVCTTVPGVGGGSCVGAGSGAFSVLQSFDIAGGAKIEIIATNWFGWDLGGILGGTTGTASYGVMQAVLNVDNFSATRVGPGAGALTMDATGFDYTMPPGPLKSAVGASSMIYQSGPTLDAGAALFTKFYADDLNSFPGPGDLLDQCLATQGSGGANSRSCAIAANWADVGGGSFSMRIAQEIQLAEGQSVKTQGSLTTQARVPEPMTLSLVSLALLGAGIAARRRSQKA